MKGHSLTISNLKKTYRSGTQALRGIELEIPRGLFGLLGPNGAGKTTLMKILATLLKPDEGSAKMDGIDLITDQAATRQMLGYLPQDFGLYPSFTAVQMLDYFAKLKGIVNKAERQAQIEAMLERVNLSSERDHKLGTFSGGMRQRFGIAQALLGQPKLLIVDEPTAGLDPEERGRFHNLLAEIANDVVVILSTHIVSDISTLCGRMAIIRRGEIIASARPTDAINQLNGRVWEATIPFELATEMKSRLNLIYSQILGGYVRLRVLSDNGRPEEAFSSAIPSLDDYYFSLVNRN